MKGKIEHSAARADQDPDTERPVSVSQGVFSSPLHPEELGKALSEAFGIRNIVPTKKQPMKSQTEWANDELLNLMQSLGDPRKSLT